mgnify:CR=1 FL=1
MTEYIEKNATIAKLTRLEVTEPLSTMIDAKRMLADMPAADVAPVRWGRWIEDKNTFPGFNLANNLCSECGECAGTWPKRLDPRDKYAFCPWCGAKMEVPNDD